jgi:hypothetical protein
MDAVLWLAVGITGLFAIGMAAAAVYLGRRRG